MAIICVTVFILPDHAAAMTTPSLAATDRRPVMANSLARITMTIHLGGTCLPVGGEGTHAVFSGHRGLPSALLFSDLDQMQLGDHFSLRILGEQLLYEVDQILVVEPDEVKDLYPVEGEDLVTLVTCTPYGVNTHRLLVRGHRIPLETVEETVEVTVTQQVVHSLGWKGKLLIGALLLFLLILLILALLRRKKKKTGPKEGNVRKGEN